MTLGGAVCVVGHGKVGSALARGFRAAGLRVQHVHGRSQRIRPRATSVILCVPDGAIAEVAARLALQTGRSVVLHCAGARSPEELAACRPQAAVARFHPLASFADRRNPPALDHITFVCVGDAQAITRARALARVLGARCARARVDDARYHAAAALLANGAAALTFSAQEIVRGLGLTERDSRAALAALLASVAENVRTLGVPAALTGPVARGDHATVARHAAALGPEHAETYRALLPAIVRCARAQGLPPAAARRILRVAHQRQK